jgi:hypothetical protein
VSGKHEAVVGFPLKVGDCPSEGGISHENSGSGSRVIGLQPIGKGRLPTLVVMITGLGIHALQLVPFRMPI